MVAQEHSTQLPARLSERSVLRKRAPLSLILIGFFGWVAALPLYGTAGISLAGTHGADYGPLPLWFLGANVISSILWGMVWDRWPDRMLLGVRVGTFIAAALTILLLVAPPGLWPLIFVLMGLNMGAVVAWGRWFGTTVEAGWLGRVFGLTAAGVNLVAWIFDIISRYVTHAPSLVILLLLPLAAALLALRHVDQTVDPTRVLPSNLIDFRVKIRTVFLYALFIILFSLVAGLAYRYQVVTPVSPHIDETLRRLPYISIVLLAGFLADRYGLRLIMVTGAGVLAGSFLILGWAITPGPAYMGVLVQGAAFGLLEAAPWLLLAGLATPATAGRWFGWGLNMNVVPIFLGGVFALPFESLSPERFSLVAIGLIVLAIMMLQGSSDPLTVLQRFRSPISTVKAPIAATSVPPSAEPLPIPERLSALFGDKLTEREVEVGRLAVLGISTKDIAGQLYLSENTVKTHLRNLFRKTGTANRNDLYRLLVEEFPSS